MPSYMTNCPNVMNIYKAFNVDKFDSLLSNYISCQNLFRIKTELKFFVKLLARHYY